MAAADARLATRLIICVDGTQSNSSIAGLGNQTNIHRLQAGIKRGKCLDSSTSRAVNQVVSYVPGIGLADSGFSTERIQASVLGQGHLKQIQDVYESCCQLNGSRDEIYFFGFSRGAYVVRAVAGLLHHFGAITSAGQPEFAKDFKRVLKESERVQGSPSLALSPVSTLGSGSIKPAPRIQFVGAFDTVKPGNDNIFDLSFNGSIQHMRHALALHEDRKALTPDYLFPEEFYGTALREYNRSFIQAYFIGNHGDMGGCAKNAGLGLYPLQWMLLEAKSCGLCLSLSDNAKTWADSDSPLSVVFPKPKKQGRKGEDICTWSCTTANGIVCIIRDLREVHRMVHYNEDFAIKLNTRFGSMRMKKSRQTFDGNGTLRGYCDWAPQGTIIHPSVYLLLDEHINVALETKELKLQRQIEDWRDKMLGSKNGIVNTGFWLDDEEDDDTPNVGAIRVLVCGNTGVGKSTLINKTFGVDVTQSSNRTRGIHDVRQEITFEGRPDLIVHDSGGFEAGADEEFHAIEAFLKDMSAVVDVTDRLHVIWFAIDINSPRTLQTATEKLFQAVSTYAKDVPIVVVATKKDDFLDIEFGTHRKALKKEGKRFDEEACEQYAEERLQERIEIIRNELESVPSGRLDACLAVSQDDEASIAHLSKTTSHCFDTDKVRLLYIRAQVTRIDLKIDLATCEVMRRYKRLLRSTTGSSFAPMGATINRKASTVAVTKAIINCFGLPTVSADAAVESLKTNVWSTLGSNVALALADTFQLIGLTGTIFAAGIPAWLVTGAINSTYVVPATTRLFLIMAVDLILVLARSFKEVTFRANGQPNEKDVSAAARNYRLRGYSQHVHRDIKELVPRRNVAACYRVNKISRGVETIFTNYKDMLMENVDLPLKVRGLSIGTDLEDDTSTEADSLLLKDIEEARVTLTELEAKPPAAELDVDSSIAELPAESKTFELGDSSAAKKPYELQA